MKSNATTHPCGPRLWSEAQAIPRNSRNGNLTAVDEGPQRDDNGHSSSGSGTKKQQADWRWVEISPLFCKGPDGWSQLLVEGQHLSCLSECLGCWNTQKDKNTRTSAFPTPAFFACWMSHVHSPSGPLTLLSLSLERSSWSMAHFCPSKLGLKEPQRNVLKPPL